jgi:cytochrome P450
MTDLDTAECFPTARQNPFDLPAGLDRLRAAGPLSRLRYPDGHLGWLVTGYHLARAVLADSRFSARSEFKRTPVSRPGVEPFYGRLAVPGWLVDMDRPEHTRIRRALAAHFTSRWVQAELRTSIGDTVREHLEAMAAAGPPADLVEAFALPVASLAICEVLGVPPTERGDFQRMSAVLFALTSTAGEAAHAMCELEELLRELTLLRRREPRTDLLSVLATTTDLALPEIVGVATLLLTAGHETTSNSVGLATFHLLCDPAQRARLPHDVEAMPGPVDELLRHLTVFHLGVPRTPTEDVELAGHTLRRGESVTVSLAAANRDPARFDEPDLLQLDRRATGHLAFGHGVHQCVGQHLARLELVLSLHGLFSRFPTLWLACAPDDVPLSTDMGVYGVHALPAAW